MSNAPFDEIEAELAKFPPAVMDTYREAADAMESSFSSEELLLWAKEGVAIARADGEVLGIGGGILPGVSPGGPFAGVSFLYAMGPLRHLSFAGFAGPGRLFFQGQPFHSFELAASVYSPLGRSRPKSLQGHLEVQHSLGQVFRGQSRT